MERRSTRERYYWTRGRSWKRRLVDGEASMSQQEDGSKANGMEEAVPEPVVVDWAEEVEATEGDGVQQKKVDKRESFERMG
ncbi:unnamed protein product [Lampetra planeri]